MQDGFISLGVEFVQKVQNLPAVLEIEHGGGFVEDENLAPHGQDSGEDDFLLLPSGEEVGGMIPVFLHPHPSQALLHLADNVRGFQPQIFQAESHIFFHDGRNDLIFGVRKTESTTSLRLQSRKDTPSRTPMGNGLRSERGLTPGMRGR